MGTWLIIAGAAVMDPAVKVAIIAAIPGIVASILGIINRHKLEEIHVTINSRLSQLLDKTDQAARAEGHRQGLEANLRKAAKEQMKP